jgi:hypothetical protein
MNRLESSTAERRWTSSPPRQRGSPARSSSANWWPSLVEIRYEDLLETPIETLGRVADFLGLAAPDDALSEAVAANTAQEMRQRERAGGPLFPANPGGRFVRAGRAGSWKDHFSAEDLSLFLQQTDGVLAQLGYLDSNEQDG